MDKDPHPTVPTHSATKCQTYVEHVTRVCVPFSTGEAFPKTPKLPNEGPTKVQRRSISNEWVAVPFLSIEPSEVFVKFDQWTKRWQFLYFERGCREEMERAWETAKTDSGFEKSRPVGSSDPEKGEDDVEPPSKRSKVEGGSGRLVAFFFVSLPSVIYVSFSYV